MAKKPTHASPASKSPVKAPSKAPPPTVSPVRNTSVPKAQSPQSPQSPAKREITFDMIAMRAYEIHLSGTGGSQDDNWFRAERELRGK